MRLRSLKSSKAPEKATQKTHHSQFYKPTHKKKRKFRGQNVGTRIHREFDASKITKQLKNRLGNYCREARLSHRCECRWPFSSLPLSCRKRRRLEVKEEDEERKEIVISRVQLIISIRR